MDEITSQLQNRIKILKLIVDKTNTYLNVIKEIILGINSKEYNSVVENIATISSFISHPLNGAGDTLEIMLQTYDKISLVDLAIDSIVSVVTNTTYIKMTIYNMSSTYTTNLYRDRNYILSKIEEYRDISMSDDNLIFEIISRTILDKSADELFAFIIRHEDVINRFTIHIVKKTIIELRGEKRRRLELIIEKQKDLILNASSIDISKWKGIQGILVRYGLSPYSSISSQKDIFQTLNAVYAPDKSHDENFTHLASTGIGVIVIDRTTPSPVEFNLKGLIDLEYITANNLKTDPISGLNKKIIDRFNTAKAIPSETNQPNIVKRFEGKTGLYYIFETIDGGEKYRLLGKDGAVKVAASSIIGLIQGITTRCHQYNLMQTNDILSKCFDDKATILLNAYEEEKTLLPSSEPIRNAVIDRFMQIFDVQLKEQPVKTVHQLKSIAIDKLVISEVLFDILANSVGIHNKNSTECTMTHLVKFDSIINLFIRELERRWSDESINERIFKEYSTTNLHRILSTIFKNILTSAVDELDKSKTWTEYDVSVKEFFLEKKHAII